MIDDLTPDLNVTVDPKKTAKEAGLRYVSDTKPGITRKLSRGKWIYFSPMGERIKAAEEIMRINKLAIPPAYTGVWICPDPDGHLQASGRDARGRKQYRYHPRWREVRDANKFDRMIAFGRALPKIRRRVERDLFLPGMPRNKVLATVVRLLETTLIRVGNEEYARENKSYGLTTMRNRHVNVNGSEMKFQFRGKSGKEHEISVRDKHLARVVKHCRDLPGQDLFCYADENGATINVTSSDVNDYLREITGEEFTAKDFRTWAGTKLAAIALREFEKFRTPAEAKRNITKAIEAVARMLGNTPAICRKCYVHPAVIDAYLDGTLAETLKQRAKEILTKSLRKLQPEEAAVMGFLYGRFKEAA